MRAADWQSNIYELPLNLEKRLASDRVSILSKQPLVFAEQSENCSFIYYALEEGDLLDRVAFPREENLVVNVVSRSIHRKETIQKLEALFGTSGFTVHAINNRMCASAFHTSPKRIRPCYRLETPCWIAQACVDLWRRHMDPFVNPLPTVAQCKALLEKGTLYAILKEDEVCAAMVLDCNGRSGMIEHVVVAPEHRRENLASYMVSNALEALSPNMAIRLWVNEKNAPAIALYESLGFVEDGTVSVQLLRSGAGVGRGKASLQA